MSILNEMIVRGYQSLRSEIHDLVTVRLEANLVDLYDNYYREYPKDVLKASNELGIDFLDSNTNIVEAKEEVALFLIEEDIKTKLTQKKGYDEVLKEQDINLKTADKRILNGIQESEWFKLFDAPLGHNWFSQNANKLLDSCDEANENYPKLEKMIENIKSNWNNIDPQEPLPSIKHYKNLINKQVPDGIKDLIVKPTGNS